jgi:capsular exopolysaccharide synthesis family protein
MSKVFDALTNAYREQNGECEHPPLVQPPSNGKDRHIIISPNGNGLQFEAHRRLRDRILNLMPDSGPRTLLFISAIDGEGSQRIVVDFARTLVSLGGEIMLVDADLRLPILHDMVGVAQTPGISELVSGKSTLKEVTHRVNQDRFLIIPSGRPARPFLSTHDLRSLYASLEVIKAFADWVVFNAPPVNLYNDGLNLAKMVDGVIIVVHAEKTRRELVRNAKALLEKAGANILGVVLSDRRYHIPGWLYRRL